MESGDSIVSSIAANEASQLLRDILNVGKHSQTLSGSETDTPTASLSSDIKNAMEGLDVSGVVSGGDMTESHINGSMSFAEFLDKVGKRATRQQIVLEGNDTKNSFSVYGQEVNIITSAASALSQATPGSNKVKINPVVNYDWEHKYHMGSLVATHRNGIHVAYVLRGKSGGIVRVINRRTAERVLLKGFNGQVLDISFAHLPSILLGAVDEQGTMFIYEINDSGDGKICTNLVLQVERLALAPPATNHRIIWCPYIPDEDESTANTASDSSVAVEDAGRLLVLTHDEVAELWNVDLVTREYNSQVVHAEEVEVGFLTIAQHSQPITEASFSPDGTALATASLDGDVKFFQVYLHDKSPPRCLHQWQPHDGKPVSSLFFLDDHKNPNPEVQFWKFAVTGAEHNQEIKIWSCESWSCLQTLYFSPSPENSLTVHSEPCLKAALDLGANYLVLSDIRRKVLYILHLHQDPQESRAHVSSVSEFLLTQPCLSAAILDAGQRRFKPSNPDETEDPDHVGELTTGEVGCEEDEEVAPGTKGPDIGVLVRMYSVHTRALQELQIRFKPESSIMQPFTGSVSSISQDDIGLTDGLSDMSLVSEYANGLPSSRSTATEGSSATSRSAVSEGSGVNEMAKQHTSESHPVLLTPDAFTSPRQEMGVIQSSDGLRSSVGSSHSSLTQVTAMEDDPLRTPHTSLNVAPSQPPSGGGEGQVSPSSSVTLTPVSSREFPPSGTSSSHHMPSPSLPLQSFTSPPASLLPMPSNVGAINSSTSLVSAASVGISSSTLNQSFPPHPSSLASQDFLTSSPASHAGAKAKEFRPPIEQSTSLAVSASASSDGLDAYFASSCGAVAKRTKLQSTGSSSSTSLEVSEILEGAKKPGQDMAYEEEEEQSVPQETPLKAAVEAHEGKVAESQDEEGVSIEEDVIEEDIEVEEEEEEVDKDSDVVVEDGDDEAEGCDDRDTQHHELHDPSEDLGEQESDEKPLYDTGIWPRAPVVDNDDKILENEEDIGLEACRIAGEALQRATNHHYQHQGEMSGGGDLPIPDSFVNAPTDPPASSPDPSEGGMGRSHEDVTERGGAVPEFDYSLLHKLSQSVGDLMGLVGQQQQELEALRGELSQQRAQLADTAALQTHMENLEAAVTSSVSGALSLHTRNESERLQTVLGERVSREQDKQDQMMAAMMTSLTQTLSHTLEATVNTRLQKMISEEVKHKVLPGVASMLEPIKEQLHHEMAQKLTATDAVVKESIAKLVRSRPTIEAMGQAAGSAMEGPIQGACRDVLVPAFDRACQSMFQHLNQTFQRGVAQYTEQLSGHLDAVRRRHEEFRDPIVQQMRGLVEACQQSHATQEPIHKQLTELSAVMRSSTEQMTTSSEKLNATLDQRITRLEEELVSSMRQLVQDEVSTAMHTHHMALSQQLISAVRSNAPTPVPRPKSSPPDPQQLKSHILQLLRQGELNTAFQQGLSAADLGVVMFVCESVDTDQVFGQSPCPLQQPVLLSLIQQLSADLTSNFPLKHKYLEESLMNLDQTNPVTREHLSSVLGQLCQKLSAFLLAQPSSPHTRQIRMLQMVAKSLLK